MHLIGFWLGIRFRPRWGSSQLSLRHASYILRNFTSKEKMVDKKKTGKEKRVKRGEIRERKREREMKGDEAPQLTFLAIRHCWFLWQLFEVKGQELKRIILRSQDNWARILLAISC